MRGSTHELLRGSVHDFLEGVNTCFLEVQHIQFSTPSNCTIVVDWLIRFLNIFVRAFLLPWLQRVASLSLLSAEDEEQNLRELRRRSYSITICGRCMHKSFALLCKPEALNGPTSFSMMPIGAWTGS